MSSVVSAVIGGNAQQNVANTQAAQSDYAVNKNADVTTRGQDIQNTQYNQALTEQQKEYGNAHNAGVQALTDSGNMIDEATGAAPAELTTLASDIANKSTRTMQDTSKQVGANLATAGVRGGQAATLQNRAVGEVGISSQEDIDQLLAQNAAQRQAAQAGYATSMGAAGLAKA